MMCPYPIKLKNPAAASGYITVPCGKCLACRRKLALQWVIRLTHEQHLHKNAFFVTLTYRPEDLEEINKPVLQKYLKRLRKNSGSKIKYFACGEHGEKTHRPHYHAIIFGDKNLTKRIVQQAWPFGHTYVGLVNEKTIKYVAWYSLKKTKKNHEEDCFPPFQLQSQGLGYKYIQEHPEIINSDLRLNYKGLSLTLPRYYLNKSKIGIFYKTELKQFALALEYHDLQTIHKMGSGGEAPSENFEKKRTYSDKIYWYENIYTPSIAKQSILEMVSYYHSRNQNKKNLL